MNREEALDVLRAANWQYIPRISKERPYAAALTSYPGINVEIIKAAGIDVSGKNGEGVAMLAKDEDGNPKYAIFGRNNTLHLNNNDIEFGQSTRMLRIDMPDIEEGGSGILSR